MKQVFDEIRDNLKDLSQRHFRLWNKTKDVEEFGLHYAYTHAIAIMDEAVAKWNENVCEWKPFGPRGLWEISCDEVYACPADGGVEWFNYCPKCGKKIRVVK